MFLSRSSFLYVRTSAESAVFGEDGGECPPCQSGVCIANSESSNDGTLLISWARQLRMFNTDSNWRGFITEAAVTSRFCSTGKGLRCELWRVELE
jgi:hypothetical protein